MTKPDPADEWRLEKLDLEYKRDIWDKTDLGHYEGSVRFQNGQFESFKFNLRDDMAQEYIRAVAADVIRAATELGHRIAESIQKTMEGKT